MPPADSPWPWGSSSIASAQTAIAIGGYGAQATVNGGVVPIRTAWRTRMPGYKGYDPSTNAASVQDDSIWKATLGAVSQGAQATIPARLRMSLQVLPIPTWVNVAQPKKARTEVEGAGITVTRRRAMTAETICTPSPARTTTPPTLPVITSPFPAENVISATDNSRSPRRILPWMRAS